MTLHELGTQTPLREPVKVTKGQLRRYLAELEEQHQMTTAEFVELFQAGELAESPEFVEWSHLHRVITYLG